MQVISSSKASKVIIFGIVLSLFLLVFLTQNSLAVVNTTARSINNSFCASFISKAGNVTTRIGSLSNQMSLVWAQQDQKIVTQQQQLDQKVVTDRGLADTSQATNFSKLETKATTDAQREAVQTYENSVKSAVAIRRSAFDAARQTFHTGVQSAIDARRSTISSQLIDFKSSTSAAIAEAETSCSSDSVATATIRATFQTAMQSAQNTYRNGRSVDAKIGMQIQDLASIRDAAFNMAIQVFHASMASAKQTLVQAVGKSI